MRSINSRLYGFALVLAAICTALQVYNMVAIHIFKEQVFLERGTISSGGEVTILIAFIFVLIFTIVSLLWMFLRIRQPQVATKGEMDIFALGVLCLILFVGEKVIVDEISHEYPLGLEALGEWIVLYVCLVIQLCYCIVIVRTLRLAYKVRHGQLAEG